MRIAIEMVRLIIKTYTISYNLYRIITPRFKKNVTFEH